jgi:NarL family two-component system sensor histidine kinase YdfH
MQQNDRFVGLPFYIFISLLLCVLGVISVTALFRSGASAAAFLCALLFLIHIGLYWANLMNFEKINWQVFYYIAQTTLIVLLIGMTHGNNFDTSILASLIICMISEALGLWGNTRRSLYFGLFYFALAVTLLYFLERDDLIFIVPALMFNGGIIVLFMIVLNQQLAERQKAVDLAETLESANAKLAAYAAQNELLTLQNERQRMARELHDTLAQGVAGLVLQLEAVKTHLKLGRAERASAIVEQSLASARSTLSESRAAIDDLRAMLPTDLREAIGERVERFTQATSIPCELVISMPDDQPAMDMKEHLLRVLSEGLTNVARHAQATQVSVKLFDQNDQIHLEIQDNGKGFAGESQTNAGHYGLLGMRERARLLDGSLTIESNSHSGTNVCFVVPSSQGGEKR